MMNKARKDKDEWVFLSSSEEETEKLGAAFATLFTCGAVVALRGELAAGKTCFVRGMARVLSSGKPVHSPTFTLVNEYPRRLSSGYPQLIHVDLYRLDCVDELFDLPIDELFDGTAVCAVEWADKAEEVMPAQRVDVFFEHAGSDQRRIRFVNGGVLNPLWDEQLAQEMRR